MAKRKVEAPSIAQCYQEVVSLDQVKNVKKPWLVGLKCGHNIPSESMQMPGTVILCPVCEAVFKVVKKKAK